MFDDGFGALVLLARREPDLASDDVAGSLTRFDFGTIVPRLAEVGALALPLAHDPLVFLADGDPFLGGERQAQLVFVVLGLDGSLAGSEAPAGATRAV